MTDPTREPRLSYRRLAVSPFVRYYGPADGLESGGVERMSDEEYAKARAALPVFCLDGLVCGRDDDGVAVVVLAVRADRGPSSGPFRGEPWVVGGRWDLATPWEEFVVARAADELFGGDREGFEVDGPIGSQLFATSWPAGGDGPFGRRGLTLQVCYRLRRRDPIQLASLRPDGAHERALLVRASDDLETLHPYVRDVVEQSGWLCS